ncbi:MAG TPA: helix-turn-helix domain-containing protein [Candidatus Rikenella faecigallinarum]|uniref:Helix-turn-helix domain-containing protein n=1 Tax=Candidatus Rikenella faecigallinarum TaxID=2838745 RepID=A0A9D1TYT8_9BACT|nr:helix-turn-helix domain-containing protein [Candidatus Rikenella faecigallinarum]
MVDNHPFNALNLTTIPFDEQACIFDNQFILAGDLDDGTPMRDLNQDPTMRHFLTSPYPFKIQFSMLQLCLGGRMRVRLNFNEYELHHNSLQIVTPGSIGQCLEISPDCRIVLIAVSSNYIFTEENSEAALIIRKFLARQRPLELTDAQTSQILSICRTLRDKLRQADFRFKHLVLKGYMQVLYGEICQLMAPYVQEQETRQGSRKKQIFDRFLEELRQHYTTERSIHFYADRLCLTPKYLSQVILAVSGRYAGDWIRDYVILEAKALLKSGQYTVQQVSDLLNFANQSFFGVYFKRSVGCSPTAYKES